MRAWLLAAVALAALASAACAPAPPTSPPHGRALLGAPPQQPPTIAAANNTWMLGVPGRIQYGQGNGYCGEVSLQMLMLRYGVWIPQAAARAAGGGELLPGVNYDAALAALRVAYDPFAGAGFQQFAAFAKRALKAGQGVVTVVFLKGYRDPDYDHIEPVMGVTSSSDAYSPSDVFYVNNGFSTGPLARAAGGFSCGAGGKSSTLAQGGCVPAGTTWGYAIRGPAYAGIGPPVELSGLSRDSEPRPGRSAPISATLTVRNLTAGARYRLHCVKSPADVPADAGGSVPGAPLLTWTANAPQQSFPVTFESASVAYYIATAA